VFPVCRTFFLLQDFIFLIIQVGSDCETLLPVIMQPLSNALKDANLLVIVTYRASLRFTCPSVTIAVC